MSRRASTYIILQAPAEARPSPNACISGITVEVRVFYPPYMGHVPTVVDMVKEAADQAVDDILSTDN